MEEMFTRRYSFEHLIFFEILHTNNTLGYTELVDSLVRRAVANHLYSLVQFLYKFLVTQVHFTYRIVHSMQSVPIQNIADSLSSLIDNPLNRLPSHPLASVMSQVK